MKHSKTRKVKCYDYFFTISSDTLHTAYFQGHKLDKKSGPGNTLSPILQLLQNVLSPLKPQTFYNGFKSPNREEI